MHFQAQMNLCFSEMLFEALLVWIDDLLLYAKDPETYLMRLRQFFEILRRRRLKLNAAKCTLFARSVKWCGRVIDGSGTVHDKERLGALMTMPPPPTAAGLQHFLCASNWMRDSIVDYARGVAPLQRKLENVMAIRGRRKAQLSGVQLVWSTEERAYFADAVKLLATAAKLSFPDADARVCLFTDASASGWATVVTQVVEWDSTKAVAQQQHQLTVCTGGLFTKSQANWSVIEKEAYPIVVASSELRYLLDRERGFHIYCDHANLIRVFSPDKELGQHIQGKLQRWALKLVGCRYVIEHIAGEDNVWADIVSRWGQQAPIPNATIKRVTTRGAIERSVLRPMHDDEFVWPSLGEIRGAQEQHSGDAPLGDRERDGVLRVDGRPWIPARAHELLQRLLVISHCGAQGHRGEDVMVEALQRRFTIPAVRQQVQRFVRACLLCKHVKGGQLVQRQWQDHDMATKRNECLHMDYLYLGESYGNARYVLLLKDELTHYCELVACDQPTAQVAVDAILDWFKRFGLPETWVSDNGSHFKATLVQEVAQRLKSTHKFVPVYSPWLNGTVERVNRDMLQVLRVMLMELQWDTKNWTALLPVIQANLNHSPVRSLGGHAPVELFTGLPAASLLDSVALPVGGPPRAVPTGQSVTVAMTALREHMEALHRDAVGRKEQRRRAAQEKHNGRPCNFEPGDFVLWSRVDKRLRGSKLLVRWVGPFKVVQALPYSYMIEHLLTADQYDVHGSRLKFYHDSDLNVTAELRQHVGNQGIVLGVRAIVAHRFNRETQVWELCVSWQGLDDAENSWEPIAGLVKDVPRLVRQYIMAADEPRLEQFL
jgi:transposase InsO family protein